VPVDLTLQAEGDTFDAASLNDSLGDVETGLNALTEQDIDEGALSRQHLPSLVIEVAPLVEFVATHVYTEADCTWPGFNNNAVAPGVGWREINTTGSPGGGTDLETTFAVARTIGSDNVGGILVLADIHLQTIRDTPPVPGAAFGVYACFAIQIEHDTGGGAAWETIGKTERYVDMRNVQGDLSDEFLHIDVPIRTLIKAADSTSPITKVRAVTAIYDPGAAGVHETSLRHCNLTALVLHAGAP